MYGYLILEDGTVFRGTSFGFDGAKGGEVVFNTAMTGYQEILTDPSYDGQIVCMTYPHIGNYGVNREDVESRAVFAAGFVVREYCRRHSNWRASGSLSDYLCEHRIVALEGIDTRALTRKLRNHGSLRGVIGTETAGLDRLKELLPDVPPMAGQNLAARVASGTSFPWVTGSGGLSEPAERRHVVVVDCGVKYNILRRLVDEGARVTVVPPTAKPQDILALQPQGLLISNGPGDPDAVTGLPDTLRSLIGRLPMLGICLGHQLLALAAGARTYKLKFGHHGANHPVRNERTRRIEITSQNHGFAVEEESLRGLPARSFGRVNVTHVHLSDGTVEGFEMPDVKVTGIQYHPEAHPGPHDAGYVFSEFLACISSSSSA
jgi:carbamoyl-phosphate synthase small subunit